MRLFVAVVPPERALDQLAELMTGFGVVVSSPSDPDDRGGSGGGRGARDRVRWTNRSQWHITLRFLGNVIEPEEVVNALEGADLAATSPVEAAMGRAVERLGRGVLCVPVAGLDELAVAVTKATAHIGQPPEPRPFHGHLTLARLPRKGRVDTSPWVGRSITARWPVDEVHLMRSRTDPDSARYQTLYRASLGS